MLTLFVPGLVNALVMTQTASAAMTKIMAVRRTTTGASAALKALSIWNLAVLVKDARPQELSAPEGMPMVK